VFPERNEEQESEGKKRIDQSAKDENTALEEKGEGGKMFSVLEVFVKCCTT
jgi:hypothetical protein